MYMTWHCYGNQQEQKWTTDDTAVQIPWDNTIYKKEHIHKKVENQLELKSGIANTCM